MHLTWSGGFPVARVGYMLVYVNVAYDYVIVHFLTPLDYTIFSFRNQVLLKL